MSNMLADKIILTFVALPKCFKAFMVYVNRNNRGNSGLSLLKGELNKKVSALNFMNATRLHM